MRVHTILLFCCLLVLHAGDDPSRGMKPLSVTGPGGDVIATFAESRALIIGNGAYTGGWPALGGVGKDVEQVRACLERQGFSVQVAENLTKQGLSDTLDTFIEERAQREDARVLIYYAGHGHTRDGVGYLVGVDAPLPTAMGFMRKAYEIAAIKIKARQARSRHVLFVFDSCFAGTLFTPMRGAAEHLLTAAREPVRMFLTAGSADEQVPDQSFFCSEFVAGIEGRGDANHDGWVTGSELALYLRQSVADRAAAAGIRLTPQAGVSEQEGFNRGDFVFRCATPPAGAGDTVPATRPEVQPAVMPAQDWANEVGRDRFGNWASLNVWDCPALRMRLIPAGTYRMGSEDQDERPIREITITQPFWLADSEVTQHMWRAVMSGPFPGNGPSSTPSRPSAFAGDALPVEQVSWDDCHEFLRRMRFQTPCKLARLPSEAEWEYACRAGAPGDNNVDAFWHAGTAQGTTHAVNSGAPNDWGLYNMRGNVMEWCADWFAPYVEGPQRDPRGPAGGTEYVVRGGGWSSTAAQCRASTRLHFGPGQRSNQLGLRLAVSVTPQR